MIGNDTANFDVSGPIEVVLPARRAAPLVYGSPHSGDSYPESFLVSTDLTVEALRRSADLFVDDLLMPAVEQGVPLIKAHFPRCFVDVNREPLELDPAMFEGRLPVAANTRSAKVQAGYGVIARLVAENQPIYRRKLPVAEAFRRIDQYHLPYHGALERLLAEACDRFGEAILIDWHSMPSAVFPTSRSIDVVLGDRHGASCAPDIVDLVESVLLRAGLSVQRNVPYAGGYITQRYGQPDQAHHVLQIEINRALYMDERRQQRHAGFQALQAIIAVLTETLLTWKSDQPHAMAAE